MKSATGTVRLVRHPDGGDDGAVRSLEARVRRTVAGEIRLRFDLDADPARVRITPAREPRFAVGLWRTTCFEAFVAIDGAAAYHEWNLSPSGEWAAHAFRAYRDGGPVEDPRLAPGIVRGQEGDRVSLEAGLPLAALSPRHATARLRVGLSAVVETTEGGLSFWALRHAPGAPDFHHADAFALRLEPPES